MCEQFHSDGVVCPPHLRQGLFITAAIDNIDHNPSSVTATDSFHGTGISLFEHPSLDNEGHDCRQSCIIDGSPTNKRLLELPESYTNVLPLVPPKKDTPIPKADYPFKNDSQVFNLALQKEFR